jgi:hypothetical protein
MPSAPPLCLLFWLGLGSFAHFGGTHHPRAASGAAQFPNAACATSSGSSHRGSPRRERAICAGTVPIQLNYLIGFSTISGVCAMSRLVKLISPNSGSGYYWEVRTNNGKVVARGVADTHDGALNHAKAAAAKAKQVVGWNHARYAVRSR